jgi:DNA-binding MarR family transcriptional regulator
MQGKKFDLIMQLTRVEWLLHKYHQQNHMNFGPMGDTRKGQGRILSILKMKPEISQKELSYLLEMRPQSMGELLTKLEKKGYISRTPSETDRRVLNIKLTKEGEEATAESTESEFSFDKVFECLNDEEQQNLSSYLDSIIRTLESQVNEEQSELDFDPRMRGGNPYHGKGDPRFGGRNPFVERFGDQANMNGAREPRSGIPPVQGDFGPWHEMNHNYGGNPDRQQSESDHE